MRECKQVIKFEWLMVMKLLMMMKKTELIECNDYRIECENHIIRLDPKIDNEYSFTVNGFYKEKGFEWCDYHREG